MENNGFVLFKLGDPRTGWAPTQQMRDEFADLLVEAGFKGPAIVYHYAIEVEDHGAGYKIIRLGDRHLKWKPSEREIKDLTDEVNSAFTPGSIVVVPIVVHPWTPK